jgi:hypothetical protein
MNKRSKLLALADALLTPKHIGIAEEVIQKHLDTAIVAKDKARLKELYDIVSIVESAKSEG